jgi:TonB-linked SusC/RagA family outer membrane protein
MKRKVLLLFLFLFIGIGLVNAQVPTVTGVVTSDEDGSPVPGATIRVKGTQVGTVTDLDGRFILTNLPNSATTLQISYIGMKEEEVAVKPKVLVVLHSNQELLDEVVVTGYGSFKKSSFTGSASTVSTAALENVPVVSVTEKLQGSVPGVSFGSSSSNPGAVSSIRIRGMGSINAGNNPLYVIDGTPVTSGDISDFGDAYNDAGTDILATLNSNDIESITVIKDAAAASLYGSRAANGVIVITTKSGREGKTHVSFSSDWGFSEMAINYRPQLSGEDRRALLTQGLENYGYSIGYDANAASEFAASYIDYYAAVPENGYTNWKDLLFKTGNHQNYQFSVSGGSDRTKFYTSLSYTNQDGIIANQGLERFTGNANLTHKFGDFVLQATTQISKMAQQKCNEGTSYDGALANYCFFQSPSETPFNEDGSISESCGVFGVNPLYEQQHSKNTATINKAFSTVKLTWNIWDKLNLSEKIAYDITNGKEDILWDRYSNNGSGYGGLLQRDLNTNTQTNTQTQLTYINNFGKHNVDALLGFETEDSKYEWNYMSGNDYPGELYEIQNAGDASAETGYSAYRLTSFLGRVNYNFANRYYLGVSFREDGSSRLARDKRWGSFWSVSGAWRFFDEKFLKDTQSVITDGKLRLSYGVNGTQPSDYYAYLDLYKYGIKYNGTSGLSIVGIANPDLKWEKNKTWNIGLDLTFIDRIAATLDVYERKTSDLIYDLPVSQVGGYYDSYYGYTMPQNIGAMKNRGFELTITSTNFNTKDFSWTTTLNMAHNTNKLSKLDGETDEIVSGPLIHRIGKAYYSYYLYEYAGVDPTTGKESYYINDGTENARNTTTNVSEANKVIVGKHEAKLEGGLTNNLRWKMIDLGFTFTYSIGGDAYDYATWQHSNGGSYLYYGAVPAYYDINKIWSEENPNGTLPKFEYGSTAVASSRWLMPTDYLRLKNLTLGATIPAQYTRKIGLSKARVYFSGSNLLTWKQKGLYVDPEMPVSGLCTFETPSLKTYTFGLELNF